MTTIERGQLGVDLPSYSREPVDNQFVHTRTEGENVSPAERAISMLGGGALMLVGLVRGGLTGLGSALIGGGLLYRGATGHCGVYERLGVSTSGERSGEVSRDIRVDRSITINRPIGEVYRFWRALENLPRFMNHVESVRQVSERRSHWVMKVPLRGTLEWETELVDDVEGSRLSWRSVAGSPLTQWGEVIFKEAPGKRGTEIHLTMHYVPPAGAFGVAVGKLLDDLVAHKLLEDLRRLKSLLEAGEVPTTRGQPVGPGAKAQGLLERAAHMF